MTPEYRLVPARSLDETVLLAFASQIWPVRPARILTRWWRRADPSCATAAVEESSGAMAGLCGGRPSGWVIGDRVVPAVGICDWYVSPGHAGRGIGKRLVEGYDAPERFSFAFSMSEAASTNFAKLGWSGPHASSLLLLLAVRGRAAVRGGVELRDHDVATERDLAEIGSALERVEESAKRRLAARMSRGLREWTWRLSVCAARRYRFTIAYRSGNPIGYAAVRRLEPGSTRMWGGIPRALIVDLVAETDEPGIVKALASRAASIAAELGALMVVAATTNPSHVKALTGIGFVASDTPLVGRILRRHAPVFMWRPKGPGAAVRFDAIHLSPADSDGDLIL